MIARENIYLPSVSLLAERSPSAIMSTKDVVPSPNALRSGEAKRWARVSQTSWGHEGASSRSDDIFEATLR